MSSAQPSLNICGIFPPLAIPFDEDENISYENLEENMNKWNKIDFGGCRAMMTKGMVFRYTWVYSKEDTMAHTYRLVVTS